MTHSLYYENKHVKGEEQNNYLTVTWNWTKLLQCFEPRFTASADKVANQLTAAGLN